MRDGRGTQWHLGQPGTEPTEEGVELRSIEVPTLCPLAGGLFQEQKQNPGEEPCWVDVARADLLVRVVDVRSRNGPVPQALPASSRSLPELNPEGEAVPGTLPGAGLLASQPP